MNAGSSSHVRYPDRTVMSRRSGDLDRYRGARPAVGPPICLAAKWHSGPRTQAWDELWQRLIVGLLADAREARVLDGRDPARSAES